MASTPDDRRTVRAFLAYLAELHPDGWDGLMRDARVPSTTAQEWRYGKRALPSATHMLNLLRAAAVLDAEYRLPQADDLLQGAQQAAAEAGQRVRRLAPPAQGTPKKASKRRSSQ